MPKLDNISRQIETAIRIRKNAQVRSNRDVIGVVVCDGKKSWQATSFDDALGISGQCAEQTALFYALSNGAKRITAIIICVPKSAQNRHPCGNCLQAIKEFAPKAKLIKVDEFGNRQDFKLQELLPD